MTKLSAVQIDSREPKWAQRLSFGDSVPTVVSTLETGDYHLWRDDGDIVIIERKDAGDLLGSIADGRIFEQAARLSQLDNNWVYVLVTGALSDISGKVLTDKRMTGWDYNSVMGALLTVQEMGVAVTFGSDDTLADDLQRIAERSHGSVRVSPRRDTSLVSDKAAVLMSIPGIGETKASELLGRSLNDLADAISYALDDTIENSVKLIGEKTQAKIREFFGLEENELLEVITK